MNKSIFNLNEFFSPKFFHDQRGTIAEPSPAKDGRPGITMAIDEALGNAMTIGELHWSLSTGLYFSRPVMMKKIKLSRPTEKQNL